MNRITINDLEFNTTPARLPERLVTSLPRSSLNTAGETMQIETLAEFSDGGQGMVDGRAQFTTYRSSNPRIASVNEEGMVTAHRNGRAYITALNNGVSSSAEVMVSIAPLTTVTGIVRFPDRRLKK